MELRDFEKINPMTVDFRGLSITFNPDAFTDSFYFAVAERFRSKYTAEVHAAIEPPNEAKAPEADAKEDIPVEAQNVLRIVDTLADRIKLEGEKIASERDFFIALLVGLPDAPVLLDWDLTDNGVSVPCNEEGLRTFKRKETLEDLWQFVRNAANPKSQGIETIPQNQTTSETTQSPSASPATPADESPIM